MSVPQVGALRPATRIMAVVRTTCVFKFAIVVRRALAVVMVASTVTMPRPLREEPYYFDIRDDAGNVTRNWSTLGASRLGSDFSCLA